MLVLNPAVGVSFLITIKLVDYTAFMESWRFLVLSLFLFLLLLDSYFNNVIKAILEFTLSPDVLSVYKLS